MSIEKERRSIRGRRADQREGSPIHDERDEDSEQVPPPLTLVALFVIPLVLLIVWAMTQG